MLSLGKTEHKRQAEMKRDTHTHTKKEKGRKRDIFYPLVYSPGVNKKPAIPSGILKWDAGSQALGLSSIALQGPSRGSWITNGAAGLKLTLLLGCLSQHCPYFSITKISKYSLKAFFLCFRVVYL